VNQIFPTAMQMAAISAAINGYFDLLNMEEDQTQLVSPWKISIRTDIPLPFIRKVTGWSGRGN